MIADCVVAWVKCALTNKNIDNLDVLEREINKVRSVKAEYISHVDPRRPCYTGWSAFLLKHLKKIPTGFIANYIFEFFEGMVTMKHLTKSLKEQWMLRTKGQ